MYESKLDMDTQTKPSRLIGPEDVKRGDYVTVTHTMYEFYHDICPSLPDDDIKIMRATVMSDEAGQAKKVIAVCLPFVLVENSLGRQESLDLRRHRIARLSKSYGREAFKKKKDVKKPDVKLKTSS